MEIKKDYIIVKLNNINIISKLNKISKSKNKSNSNIIILKGDHFSISSSYENFNSLSKNILINNQNLQKKIKTYLKRQIIHPKFSNEVIKIKNLNLFFNKVSDGNLVNNTNKANKLSVNNKNSVKTFNNISFDSKNQSNNNISINGIPLNKYNNLKKETNKDILNRTHESTFDKILSKTSSHLSLNKVGINRKLSVNYSFNPLIKSGRNSFNKINKSIEKVKTKSNNDLLSLINDNILNSKKNLIEPDKFYRHYFNELIKNNNHSNKQSNSKERKYRRQLSINYFPKFSEECRDITPKLKIKRQKSYCNENIYD